MVDCQRFRWKDHLVCYNKLTCYDESMHCLKQIDYLSHLQRDTCNTSTWLRLEFRREYIASQIQGNNKSIVCKGEHNLRVSTCINSETWAFHLAANLVTLEY